MLKNILSCKKMAVSLRQPLAETMSIYLKLDSGIKMARQLDYQLLRKKQLQRAIRIRGAFQC